MGNTAGEIRPWTTRELTVLRKHAAEGAAAIAELLDRTPKSVMRAAERHGISLRRPGERRGVVLGQPRGISLRQDLRADFVTGRVDPQVVVRRIQMDKEADLCPSCGTRPIRVARTGLCRVCHFNLLTQGHHEVIEELTSRREYNRVKQKAKRLRDQTAAEASA